MKDYKPLQKLTSAQVDASAPYEQVWLAASAGTGKTQVLSARVLRLLLNGVKPETLLCLTFTKGGAAEMAERVHSRLAAWVRAPDKLIHADLAALDEARTSDRIAYARTLFARVLDARGGGLRIQTIHSFCQTLLAGFPAEAGLTPGFRPMEERETALLAKTVLADLVRDAAAQGGIGFIERLRGLALQLGEERVQSYLMSCARKASVLDALGSGVEAKVRATLGLPLGDVEALIEELCEDGSFDRIGLELIRDLNAAWKTSTGFERAATMSDWLESAPVERSLKLDALIGVWTTAKGERRAMSSGPALKNPDYPELCEHADQYFKQLLDKRKQAACAQKITDALLVGQHYARAFDAAKRAKGWVDFDDLIRMTASLLKKPGMGDWIRYKLDQATDHILIDEAQDTNSDQWEIIQALAGEFYAGDGLKPDIHRTIFAVGDAKQAIFSFQGTDPRAMLTAREWFDAQAQGAQQVLLNLNLAESYRSSPPVLALVDAVIAHVGAENMGLDGPDVLHKAALGKAGHILLLPPVSHLADDEAESEERNEQGWVPPSTRFLAQKLAEKVAGWLNEGLWIEDGRGGKSASRRLEPKDVMILLRSRSDLAQLIVARLHEAHVPVAGVDRLRLNTPLVVRDVLAAIRFALQPHDDLNLACLLVSPLISWSQEELQAIAIEPRTVPLWRQMGTTQMKSLMQPLNDLLVMGDRHSPARFIEALLSGPMRGRTKLIERFGNEARDPLDELMNAALAFERAEVPSLQGFLDWFERGNIDIKRDATAEENAVRVMTVHAAKGLQAPLVILADATSDPGGKHIDWLDFPMDGQDDVPFPNSRKEDRPSLIAKLADDKAARELEEHYRLLYVALTRAEERLVIWGTQKKKPLSEKSWYQTVRHALTFLGRQADEEGMVEYGEGAAPNPASRAVLSGAPKVQQVMRLDWMDTLAPKEQRPPRPLSPSALMEDSSANPPPSPALQAAAERGRLLHALFERLPDVASDQRRAAAELWLAGSAGVDDAATRAGLISDALAVIEDPRFADMFSTDALAEAPVAGIVDRVVIAGTVDRLLVTNTRVTVIDFKTARRVPRDVSALPHAHLRQMSAYVAVLQGIFPGHEVRAVLLYSNGPTLFELDAELMAAHKPSFALEQIVLSQQA